MMKKLFKVVYRKVLLFCLVLLSGAVLQGCTNSPTKPQNTKEAEILSEDVTYEGRDIVLQGMEGEVQQYSMKEDALYVLTSGQEKSHLYKAKPNEENTFEIAGSLLGDVAIENFYVDENNDILCLISTVNVDSSLELVKINEEGKEVAKTDLQEELSLAGENILKHMTVDSLGNIILSSGNMMYVLDSDLHLVNKFSVVENYEVLNFVRTKSGKIACVVYKGDDSGATNGKICILDTEKGEWGKFLSLVDESRVDEHCLMEGKVYDFYYKDGGGVYGYNSEEMTWTVALDARCSLLTMGDIERMANEDDGSFLGALSGSENNENGFVLQIYSKINPEEAKNQKVITFAGYNVPNQLRIVAREFNKQHKDCRIEIQIYEDEEHTRLALDIAAGKVPDVFSISSLGIPMEQLVRKGILEDLMPYYEKDTTVSMDDLHPSVLQGMKQGDKLYCVAPWFSIGSAACRTSDVGEKTGWTLDEMKEALSKKGEGTIVVDSLEKDEILFALLISSMDEFINWDTGECDFDSQEFKDILELCNSGILPESDHDWDEQFEEIEKKMQEGKVLLSVDQSVTLEGIQIARQSFGVPDITYIGLPTKDRQGSYFVYSEQYGIYSGSDVKAEAWEFIRMVMSEEYQINTKYLDSDYFPTRKDCLEWKFQAWMATEAYEDKYGNYIEPMETNTWSTAFGTKFKTGPASQEDVDIMSDLIKRTNKRAVLDNEGMGIILEDAQMYFHGEKSLDATAKTIQQRMKTYVNEQR